MAATWQIEVKALIESDDSKRLQWLEFAVENIDEWTASQLADFKPVLNLAELLDVSVADQRASSLFERVMARKTDLLNLQGQAYLEATSRAAQLRSRSLVRELAALSSSAEPAQELSEGLASAVKLFMAADDPLGISMARQAQSSADSSRSSAELAQRTEKIRAELFDISEAAEDRLHEVHRLSGGPFDFQGRYKRMRDLYINDFKSLVACANSFIAGASTYEELAKIIPAPPDFRSSDYIEKIGPILQRISGEWYALASSRVYRSFAISVSMFNPAANAATNWTDLKTDFPPGADISRWWTNLQAGAPFTTGVTIPEEFFSQRNLREVRVEAFGIQWIDQLPAEPSRQHDFRVDCTVLAPSMSIPGTDKALPLSLVRFNGTTTTYHDEQSVQAESGPGITGLRATGRWMVTLNGIRRDGIPVLWATPPAPAATSPTLTGYILHLRVSGLRHFDPPPPGLVK